MAAIASSIRRKHFGERFGLAPDAIFRLWRSALKDDERLPVSGCSWRCASQQFDPADGVSSPSAQPPASIIPRRKQSHERRERVKLRLPGPPRNTLRLGWLNPGLYKRLVGVFDAVVLDPAKPVLVTPAGQLNRRLCSRYRTLCSLKPPARALLFGPARLAFLPQAIR